MTSGRHRVAGVAAVIVVVGALMVLTGMEPDLTLVAAHGALLAAALWFATDLAAAVVGPAPPPRPLAGPGRTGRADRRVSSLQSAVAAGRTDDRLHRTLVDIVDDRLRVAHGVDRAADPDAARRLLGEDLQRLVADPDSLGFLRRTRRLDHVVTLVERL